MHGSRKRQVEDKLAEAGGALDRYKEAAQKQIEAADQLHELLTSVVNLLEHKDEENNP